MEELKKKISVDTAKKIIRREAPACEGVKIKNVVVVENHNPDPKNYWDWDVKIKYDLVDSRPTSHMPKKSRYVLVHKLHQNGNPPEKSEWWEDSPLPLP